MFKKKYWCPNGCGKKVSYDIAEDGYCCSKCESWFHKNQLK